MHARAQSYQQEKGKGQSIDQDDSQQKQLFFIKKHAEIYSLSLLMSKGSTNQGSGDFSAQPAKIRPPQLLPVFPGFDRLQTCCHSFGPANILYFFSSAG